MSVLVAAFALWGSVPLAQERVGYLDNGKIRLGVNLDLGGAITYISKSGVDQNVVNSFDWGRQIQMSHYSGPIPFAPNGKQPTPSWAGLGWNPIQCGDSFGNRSKLLTYRNDGKSIYVKCIPMQWPLNNEPGECTFECWIRLDGQSALVRARLVNARSDKTQFQGRDQELPAVYTNGPWHHLMTYTGNNPFTNDQLSERPSVFPWTGWQATENWAALVDDHQFGLGIWNPGAYSFIGGFAGTPGIGGPKDSPTGYIAPVQREIIDHNIEYDYRYVLVLGSLAEIRHYVYKHAHAPSPPTYKFGSTRGHWIYVGASDSGWPVRGELDLTLGAKNPQLIGPDGFWAAAKTPKLFIDAALEPGQHKIRVYWKRFDDPEFSVSKSVQVTVSADGKWQRVMIPLHESPEYRGIITGIRIDPSLEVESGARMRIRQVKLG